MNIFLSWSGPVSQDVARALRKWLPYFLHSIKPFMSAVDIAKGEKWTDDLSHELRGAEYGVVCVTPFNLHKAWMNFESGALAHLPNLSPFLFRTDRAALGHNPLTQYQLTEFGPDEDHSKAEFFKLIDSINRSAPESDRLSGDVLADNFNTWWPQLKKELDAVPERSPGETRTAYKWLRMFEDLSIHDLKPNCHTVWFVSADVYKYAGTVDMREKIEANVDKIEYRYLIPEPDGSSERAAREQLVALAKAHPNRIDFRCFKRDVFEKQAASDYVVIIESTPTDNDHIRVFVRIPIATTEGEYWFETEERAAIGFYNRFSQLWSSVDDQVPVPPVVRAPAAPDAPVARAS
jgi:hypothetical protein